MNQEQIITKLDLENITLMYYNAFGVQMPRLIQSDVEYQLTHGMPYEYYYYAIHEAARAPRPSWKYAEAIIARLAHECVDPRTINTLPF